MYAISHCTSVRGDAQTAAWSSPAGQVCVWRPSSLSCRALKQKERLIAEGVHIAVPAEAGRREDWRPLVAPSYSWKLMAPKVQLEDTQSATGGLGAPATSDTKENPRKAVRAPSAGKADY